MTSTGTLWCDLLRLDAPTKRVLKSKQMDTDCYTRRHAEAASLMLSCFTVTLSCMTEGFLFEDTNKYLWDVWVSSSLIGLSARIVAGKNLIS